MITLPTLRINVVIYYSVTRTQLNAVVTNVKSATLPYTPSHSLECMQYHRLLVANTNLEEK